MLVIAVVIAGVISFFGEMVFRTMFQSRLYGGGFRRSGGDGDRKGGGAAIAIVIALVLVVIAWVLSIVIRFALSRRREYLADAGAVELTKTPDAMIGALRRLENRGELARANSAVMEMCIDNPRSGFSDLFATHPSIEARVGALVQYAGGHDPGPIALPSPEEQAQVEDQSQEPVPEGPWSDPAPPAQQQQAGPWGAPGSPPPDTQGPWGPRQ